MHHEVQDRFAAQDIKKCPFCAEIIKAEAVKCRYCGSDLAAAKLAEPPANEPSTFTRVQNELRRPMRRDEIVRGTIGLVLVVVGLVWFLGRGTTTTHRPAAHAPAEQRQPTSPHEPHSPSDFLDPTELQPGEQYTLSRKTPVMPDPDPADPMAAMDLMSYVPPGTVMVIKGTRSVDGHLWYEVTTDGDWGWVNSTALFGQGLGKVE